MYIKNQEEQKEIFIKYANGFIEENPEQNGYVDKKNHSILVMEEALKTDESFTKYDESFKRLLIIESLFHDIGRFEQLKTTGTFNDNELANYFFQMKDHGELGAIVMKVRGLLKQLIPFTRILDGEIKKVIGLHSKINNDLLDNISMEQIEKIKEYELEELFLTNNIQNRKVLTLTNTAIIQDADRLDIYRKIAKGISVPITNKKRIDKELLQLYKEDALPTINEIRQMGKWNPNVGHLVRMSFISQMNLISTLKTIRKENLIDKIYLTHGNKYVKDAYEIAKEKLDDILSSQKNEVIVRKRTKRH